MTNVSQDPIAPIPHRERRIYRPARPVAKDEIQAFLGNEDLFMRDTTAAS